MDNMDGFIKDLKKMVVKIDNMMTKENCFVDVPNYYIDCQFKSNTRSSTVWKKLTEAARKNGVLISVRYYNNSYYGGPQLVEDGYRMIVVPISSLKTYREYFSGFVTELQNHPDYLQEEADFIRVEWEHVHKVNQRLKQMENEPFHISQLDVDEIELLFTQHWAYFRQEQWKLTEFLKDKPYASRMKSALKATLQVFGK